MGPTSKLAEQFNVLACVLGKLLVRQIEHNLPQTKFAKGLNEGYSMAKDRSGILLLIVACLRTTLGCHVLHCCACFMVEFHVADWATFVETLL